MATQAMGMIEVEGVAGIVIAADAACKAAAVELAGWESTGGFTTLFLFGDVASVQAALRDGVAAAREVVAQVHGHALLQPEPACRQFIGFPLGADGEGGDPVDALGLVETRGYGLHVATNDRMAKAAAVAIRQVLTVHNRVVCSLVTGELAAVEDAIATAREALSGSEWFMTSAILPQPEAVVMQAFGHAPAVAGGG